MKKINFTIAFLITSVFLFAQTNANEFIGFLTDENSFGIHSKVATFTGEPWAEDEKLLITVTKDTSGNFAFFKNTVFLTVFRNQF